MRPSKGLQAHEVRVQGAGPSTHTGLTMLVGMSCTADFLGLLGQRLRQSGGNPKAVSPLMDGGQICQFGGEVLALPEEINKELGHVATLVEEVVDFRRFPGVNVVQEDARFNKIIHTVAENVL